LCVLLLLNVYTNVGYHVYALWFTCSRSYGYERILWRLFQKLSSISTFLLMHNSNMMLLLFYKDILPNQYLRTVRDRFQNNVLLSNE
jgi:hypothetical protein